MDLTFAAYLQTPFDRVLKVVRSNSFARFFLGAHLENLGAWFQLTSSACTLEGDPADWELAIVEPSLTEVTSRSSDPTASIRRVHMLASPHQRVRVWPSSTHLWREEHQRYSCESRTLVFKQRYEWHWTFVQLDAVNESFEMRWELLSSKTPAPSARITCTSNSDDRRKVQFEFRNCHTATALVYVQLIEEMCYIDDIVAHRGRLEAEETRIREENAARLRENEARLQEVEREKRRQNEEAERQRQLAAAKQQNEGARRNEPRRVEEPQRTEARRRFTEQAASERQNISLKRRHLTTEDLRRLSADRCLVCGSEVVIQRNNKFGHIFFGCSQWSPFDSERRCSGARPATCRACFGEMHEEANSPGVNILRCENHPECLSVREIPDRLEIHRWLPTRKVNVAEIREDFKDRGLF